MSERQRDVNAFFYNIIVVYISVVEFLRRECGWLDADRKSYHILHAIK